MSNSAAYLKKALAEVRANRERAELISESKKMRLYADIPELKRLDEKIQSLFADAAKSMLSGIKVDFDSVSAESLEFQHRREQLLAQNNITEEQLAPKYNCKKCGDSGYYNGRMCGCVKRLASKMIYDELNADVPLAECTFETFDVEKYPKSPNQAGIVPYEIMSKIGAFCVKYAETFDKNSKSLLFFGETGLGKTHLSLAIANEVIKKGYNVIYGPISHIIKCIEDERFSRSDGDKYTLGSVIDCDLLILDDLGTEFTTQFVTSAMYDIVNSRILSGRPTIINTNLDFEELERKYTPRLVSRISGCYKLFQFFGEDIRTKI